MIKHPCMKECAIYKDGSLRGQGHYSFIVERSSLSMGEITIPLAPRSLAETEKVGLLSLKNLPCKESVSLKFASSEGVNAFVLEFYDFTSSLSRNILGGDTTTCILYDGKCERLACVRIVTNPENKNTYDGICVKWQSCKEPREMLYVKPLRRDTRLQVLAPHLLKYEGFDVCFSSAERMREFMAICRHVRY